MPKFKTIPTQGFATIYYKGRAVQRDVSSSRENVLIARNKLHAWYLRWRYKKLGLRVVVDKWFDFRKLTKES